MTHHSENYYESLSESSEILSDSSDRLSKSSCYTSVSEVYGTDNSFEESNYIINDNSSDYSDLGFSSGDSIGIELKKYQKDMGELLYKNFNNEITNKVKKTKKEPEEFKEIYKNRKVTELNLNEEKLKEGKNQPKKKILENKIRKKLKMILNMKK